MRIEEGMKRNREVFQNSPFFSHPRESISREIAEPFLGSHQVSKVREESDEMIQEQKSVSVENEAMQEANMKYYYDQVTGKFDKVLAEHGYVRDGHYYRVEKANNDTLVFFCHFGLGCVLISHLLSMSPMVLWHNLCAAPSSVTTLTSEERRKGIAGFRMNSYGDISHLYAHDEPPAFAARFCECYDNDERHD